MGSFFHPSSEMEESPFFSAVSRARIAKIEVRVDNLNNQRPDGPSREGTLESSSRPRRSPSFRRE